MSQEWRRRGQTFIEQLLCPSNCGRNSIKFSQSSQQYGYILSILHSVSILYASSVWFSRPSCREDATFILQMGLLRLREEKSLGQGCTGNKLGWEMEFAAKSLYLFIYYFILLHFIYFYHIICLPSMQCNFIHRHVVSRVRERAVLFC